MDRVKNCRPHTSTLIQGIMAVTATAVSPLKFRLRMHFSERKGSSWWRVIKMWVRHHPLYSGCLAILSGINTVPILSFAVAYYTVKITMKAGEYCFQGIGSLLGYEKSPKGQPMDDYWGIFSLVPTTRQKVRKIVSLYDDVADFHMLEECTKLTNENTCLCDIDIYSNVDDYSTEMEVNADSAPNVHITEDMTNEQIPIDHPDIIRGLNVNTVNEITCDLGTTEKTTNGQEDSESNLKPVTDISSTHGLSTEDASAQPSPATSIREGRKSKSKKLKKRISWPFLKKKGK